MPSDTNVNPAQQTSIGNAQALVKMFNRLGYDKVEARDNILSMDGSGSHDVIDFATEKLGRVGDFNVVVYRTLSLPVRVPVDTATDYEMFGAGLLYRMVQRGAMDPESLVRTLFMQVYGGYDWTADQFEMAFQAYRDHLMAPVTVPFLQKALQLT